MLTKTGNVAATKYQEVLNRLKHQRLRCYDAETSGLDWKRNHIVGHVLSFGPAPQDSYYLPVRHAGGGNWTGEKGPQDPHGWDGELAPGEAELLAAIDEPVTTMFGHNMAFDLKFLYATGAFRWQPRVEDTVINAPLLNEYAPSFKLEACAAAAGVQAKKSKQIEEYICSKFPEVAAKPRTAMGHYWRLSGDDVMVVEYAEGDGTTTWQLRDWQMKEIASQGLELVHDVESRLIPILARMTVRGIRIDEEYLDELRCTVDLDIERLLGEFPSGFGVWDKAAIEAYMTDHGITDWPLTAGRVDKHGVRHQQPSFTADWFDKSEPGKKIVKIRKLTHLRDTFIVPLMETHDFNGRVHAEFNQLRGDEYGTITGRLSSSHPNMQQVPKHDKELAKIFRRVFIPDEGKRWASVDYSQIEPRLLAFYTRCKLLRDGYNANPPLDAHTSASMGMRPDWEQMTPAERKAYRDSFGKRINQTLITGGGKGVLVSKYKVDPAEVDAAWNAYFRAMPEIRPFQKRAAHTLVTRGYVMSLLRRRARYRDKDYVALNRLLQCGNADILKLKLVEMQEYIDANDRGANIDILNNCHDAFDFQFDNDGRAAYDDCLRIMKDFSSEGAVIKLDVPVEVDAGEGANWAEATFGE